jgi:DedD protein
MDLKEMFSRKAQGAAPASDDPVQAARTRARQRLIGAALLLVVGVVAFPLLFETKPRPLPLDTPIVSAKAPSGAPAPGSAAPAPAPAPAAQAAPAAASSAAGAASSPAEATAPMEPAPLAEPAASAVRTDPVAAAPAKAPAAAPPTRTAPPAAQAAAAAASAPRAARFVVQVGAFSEPATAREVRLKVEKLGLKTYTQVVETEGGKRTRVRVGPFANREEAMQTLGRIQAANLPGVVLAL